MTDAARGCGHEEQSVVNLGQRGGGSPVRPRARATPSPRSVSEEMEADSSSLPSSCCLRPTHNPPTSLCQSTTNGAVGTQC